MVTQKLLSSTTITPIFVNNYLAMVYIVYIKEKKNEKNR